MLMFVCVFVCVYGCRKPRAVANPYSEDDGQINKGYDDSDSKQSGF